MPTMTPKPIKSMPVGIKLADVKHSEPLVAAAGQKCEDDKAVCLTGGQVYITGEDVAHRIYVACNNGTHYLTADEEGWVQGFTRAPLE